MAETTWHRNGRIIGFDCNVISDFRHSWISLLLLWFICRSSVVDYDWDVLESVPGNSDSVLKFELKRGPGLPESVFQGAYCMEPGFISVALFGLYFLHFPRPLRFLFSIFFGIPTERQKYPPGIRSRVGLLRLMELSLEWRNSRTVEHESSYFLQYLTYTWIACPCPAKF